MLVHGHGLMLYNFLYLDDCIRDLPDGSIAYMSKRFVIHHVVYFETRGKYSNTYVLYVDGKIAPFGK